VVILHVILVNEFMKIPKYFLLLSSLVGLYGLFLLWNFSLILSGKPDDDKVLYFAVFNTPFFISGIYCVISSIRSFLKFSKKALANLNITFLLLNFLLLPAIIRMLFKPNEANEIYSDAFIMIFSFMIYLVNKRIINNYFKELNEKHEN
jgi:uncharacterized membrane protein YagU involved in acid resistance